MSEPSAYHFYLACDCWKQRRQAALARANYTCELRIRCKGARATEMHHVRYKNLGHEPPEDLMAACAKCHRAAHGIPEPEPKTAANDNMMRQLNLFADEEAA